jgi:hypothetical protein
MDPLLELHYIRRYIVFAPGLLIQTLLLCPRAYTHMPLVDLGGSAK